MVRFVVDDERRITHEAAAREGGCGSDDHVGVLFVVLRLDLTDADAIPDQAHLVRGLVEQFLTVCEKQDRAQGIHVFVPAFGDGGGNDGFARPCR